MNIRTWSATAFTLAVCGGVGWVAGRSGLAPCGQRCTPLAAIQSVVETKPISDDEAKDRVLQLIHGKALDAIPKIENAHQRNTDECAEPPLAQPPMGDADPASPTVLPAPKREGANNLDRFDIWMLLFVPWPLIVDDHEEDELKDFFKVESEASDVLAIRSASTHAEPKSQRHAPERRVLRDREAFPHHPEVDTLEYRPSDAKKGEYEKFQRKVW